MSRVQPQRLATWILKRCASEYGRDALIGDLLEQYDQRGACWYWRQALGAVRVHTARLLLTATESHVPAAEFIGDLVMWIALGACGLIQLPIYSALLVSWTPLARSQLSTNLVSSLIAASLIGAVTAVRHIGMRPGREL